MAWDVNKSNSIQFTVEDQKLAFAVVTGMDGSVYFGLFRNDPAQGWLGLVFGNENGFIDTDLTNADIIGPDPANPRSMEVYINSQLPLMQGKLQRYLASGNQKPDKANKPACFGYDLGRDLDFDPTTLSFKLNKQPPLSHQ